MRCALPLTNKIKVGTLALVLGVGDHDTAWDKLDWQCVPLSELAFVYVAQSPDLRTPAAKRLQFFAKYLENRDPLIADDAFQEFGQVPYDVVAPAAAELSADEVTRVDRRSKRARRTEGILWPGPGPNRQGR